MQRDNAIFRCNMVIRDFMVTTISLWEISSSIFSFLFSFVFFPLIYFLFFLMFSFPFFVIWGVAISVFHSISPMMLSIPDLIAGWLFFYSKQSVISSSKSWSENCGTSYATNFRLGVVWFYSEADKVCWIHYSIFILFAPNVSIKIPLNVIIAKNCFCG